MHKNAIIRISGIVQGVGFRPFIYRIAKKHKIKGYVKNLGDAGIEILAEGDIEAFVRDVGEKKPANAHIDNLSIELIKSEKKFTDFQITKSGGTGYGGSIPADTAVCNRCLKELRSRKNRRHLYPLITCTDCGPRFTTLDHIPLDRDNTSFKDFPPCRECRREYKNPEDRRFHAQTIACPVCGPRYSLVDKEGKEIPNPVDSAVKKLKEGGILAIKGIGGMHLACLTSRDDILEELRNRLRRPQQPFSIMATQEMVEGFTGVSREEIGLLSSKERPIVVLRKSIDYRLSDLISPGLHNIGVMLPYTALHHLLFGGIDEPLVMTSANVHGEPMITGDEDIFKYKTADYYLLHNLEIINRCDDSVIKLVNGKSAFIRRSRGFVPVPIKVGLDKNVLALGAEINNTFCLLRDGNAVLSQHIGNTQRAATLEFMENTIGRFLEMMPTRIDLIACDLHPTFNTSRLAKELGREMGIPVVRVQHHHAHLASLLAEHHLEGVVGICCDGVGYGEDGRPWGGEVISSKNGVFKRQGHLREQRMPGGDTAAYYPARMVAGILYGRLSVGELVKTLEPLYFKHGSQEVQVVVKQLENDVNVQWTTSAGRVLDAVSALLGVCQYRSYEGEPAMKLEAAAIGGKEIDFPVKVEDNVLNTTLIVERVLELRDSHPLKDIAFSAQRALAEGLALIAVDVAEKNTIDTIGVSGGVAYNNLIVRTIAEYVREKGFRFVQNESVPCGDGGISFGQAVYAVIRKD
ncbi:MAG: carbamoyltransferase HypF [Candidatus Altiarchaeota archaeon]|nr:carbamoyltransferase HypF [Candidatus Altiarchaeota archaeon]